jgi:hypothetical protein
LLILSNAPAVRKNAPRILPYGTPKRTLLEALQRPRASRGARSC